VTGNPNNNGNGHSNGHSGGHDAGHVNGNGNDKPAPTGASAVVRPVPGGEHKGMLKLVEFTQPANGDVTRNADQTLTYRPKPGFTGKDSFQYTLLDEAGTQFSATVTVAVTLDTPAFKPATPRTSRKRTPAPVPLNIGEGLPRLHGGSVLFPGE